ncbi:MAG: MBL fold metallo-hydrolase [Candidatus Omnitrophota bacterium]
MILETVPVGQMQANCYIIATGSNAPAIIIDPGDEEKKIRRMLNRYGLSPKMVINTHGHIDHIGCDDAFGVPVYIHKKDAELLKDDKLNLSAFLSSPFCVRNDIIPMEDGDVVEAGAVRLKVIHTPGHTSGGICLLLLSPEDNILFTGDTLFFQGVGRTDFPGADSRLLMQSIKNRLWALSDDTVIYPGHGPSSTIGQEKQQDLDLY